MDDRRLSDSSDAGRQRLQVTLTAVRALLRASGRAGRGTAARMLLFLVAVALLMDWHSLGTQFQLPASAL